MEDTNECNRKFRATICATSEINEHERTKKLRNKNKKKLETWIPRRYEKTWKISNWSKTKIGYWKPVILKWPIAFHKRIITYYCQPVSPQWAHRHLYQKSERATIYVTNWNFTARTAKFFIRSWWHPPPIILRNFLYSLPILLCILFELSPYPSIFPEVWKSSCIYNQFLLRNSLNWIYKLIVQILTTIYRPIYQFLKLF